MQGVKILYEVTKSDNMIVGIALLLIALILAIFVPILYIYFADAMHDISCAMVTIIGLIAVFFLAYQGISRMIPINYKLVSVDDSVTVNEFYEHYEIHEKNEYGYFVKERNVDNGNGI